MTEFEQVILERLKCIEAKIETVRGDVVNLRVVVAKLTVNGRILAGFVPVVAFVAWKLAT